MMARPRKHFEAAKDEAPVVETAGASDFVAEEFEVTEASEMVVSETPVEAAPEFVPIRKNPDGTIPLVEINRVSRRVSEERAAERLKLTREVRKAIATVSGLPQPSSGLVPKTPTGVASPFAAQHTVTNTKK